MSEMDNSSANNAASATESKLGDIPSLEETCPCCNGVAGYGKCIHCNSCGVVPTTFGWEVIDLVARHLLPQD
jgi:hypothetical protein